MEITDWKCNSNNDVYTKHLTFSNEKFFNSISIELDCKNKNYHTIIFYGNFYSTEVSSSFLELMVQIFCDVFKLDNCKVNNRVAYVEIASHVSVDEIKKSIDEAIRKCQLNMFA